MKYAMLLIGAVLACTASAADYEVGDRLAPGATGEEAQNQFQETGWDDLLPEDWDPTNAIQGLDLDAMAEVEDADPRAAAALQELLAA